MVGIDGLFVFHEFVVVGVTGCRGHFEYLIVLLVGRNSVELSDQIFFNGAVLNEDTISVVVFGDYLIRFQLFRLRHSFLEGL